MTSHTPIRPTRIRIPRWSIARWRTPAPGARLCASPSVRSMSWAASLSFTPRVVCCVCIRVYIYILSACSLAAHRTGGYNTEGSGAKFPANPTNLSQPNIGCWWILIPPTRRTISHLYTDLAGAREREEPPQLFSPTFRARVRNARCSLSISVSLFRRQSLQLHAEDASYEWCSIREGLGRWSFFNTRRIPNTRGI